MTTFAYFGKTFDNAISKTLLFLNIGRLGYVGIKSQTEETNSVETLISESVIKIISNSNNN